MKKQKKILSWVTVASELLGVELNKCLNSSHSPLKRMTVGMFLAAMAFVSAALVQIQIDVSDTLRYCKHYRMSSEGNTYIVF